VVCGIVELLKAANGDICFVIHSFQIKQNRPALLSFNSAAILFPIFSFFSSQTGEKGSAGKK